MMEVQASKGFSHANALPETPASRFRRLASRIGALPKRALAAAASVLVVLGALVVHTLPEYVLYHGRLTLNILEFDSTIELAPIEVETHDGLALRSWYRAPRPGSPTIVYFPDRLGDIIFKPGHLYGLAEDGYGLLLAGYRGYGGNPGRPSEQLLYRDALSLIDLVRERTLAPDGFIIYGYSMGTGVASYAATRSSPLGLVLEAPFTSFAAAVRQQASSVPDWLVRTRFDTRSRIAGMDMPILILAGEQDWVTPAAFARTLASLNAQVSLHVFEEGNHLSIIRHGGGDAVRTFLTKLTQEAGPTLAAGMAIEEAPVSLATTQ